jgi:hypothetical protein
MKHEKLEMPGDHAAQNMCDDEHPASIAGR